MLYYFNEYSFILLLFICSLYPTLCDPMDYSMPGFAVLHYLPDFAQTHDNWFNNAIQPSHPLSPPFLPALNLSGSFPKQWSFSFSISPSNEYSGLISFRVDWFDLAVQGIGKSSLAPQFKSINSLALRLYGPIPTFIYDY